ncbi:TrmH family RNA methyltransferase [Salegentibacter chungangensis]|uniref:TrmH family RNA methyltransferase n=1 Tax=Salegentibacter chungangensis TaxID=1335724 RepID=A0ABW3NR44_9FLAO
MVSKSQIKLIKSLSQKKFRQKNKLFVAEGKKVVKELISSGFALKYLFTTDTDFDGPADKTHFVKEEDLKKLSFLKTPQIVLAVFEIPVISTIKSEGLVVALDGVRDPGNLGTIIRLCDWFGVKQLICSNDTVDCYNPKVIQATMGSIARVLVSYTDLKKFVEERIEAGLPVYGAFMDSKNVYQQSLPEEGVLVMGNEANGISGEIQALVSNRVTIPQFGETQETESLNVATATAILLSEFRRSSIGK